MRGRELAPALFGVLELVADRAEQLDEVLVVQAVEHPSSVAAGGDEPQVAQDAQLLRYRVGRELGAGGEILDGELGIDQRVEQLEPARGSERRHAFGEAFSLTVGQRASGGEMFLGTRHDVIA